MLSIRNIIVEVLCHETYIQKILTIIKSFQANPRVVTRKNKDDKVFFRLWLDILIKLANAPSRRQCSVMLEVPRHTDNTSTKARLVYPRSGHLERLFYLDKVGKDRRMPVSYPLGPFLTFFMAAYLVYVTPEGSHHVFDNSTTVRWAGKSSVFRDFLSDSKNEGPMRLPKWLFKQQKMLRRIGINALGAKFQFDYQTMEDIAIVSRHSINILLSEYAYWSVLYMERRHMMAESTSVYYYDPPELSHEQRSLGSKCIA
jgi:hypothetical protein